MVLFYIYFEITNSAINKGKQPIFFQPQHFPPKTKTIKKGRSNWSGLTYKNKLNYLFLNHFDYLYVFSTTYSY
jgi:hypothetical protein